MFSDRPCINDQVLGFLSLAVPRFNDLATVGLFLTFIKSFSIVVCASPDGICTL